MPSLINRGNYKLQLRLTLLDFFNREEKQKKDITKGNSNPWQFERSVTSKTKYQFQFLRTPHFPRPAIFIPFSLTNLPRSTNLKQPCGHTSWLLESSCSPLALLTGCTLLPFLCLQECTFVMRVLSIHPPSNESHLVLKVEFKKVIICFKVIFPSILTLRQMFPIE